MRRVFRLRHKARTRLWLVPALGLCAGIALALVTTAVDRSAGYDLVGQSVTGTASDVQTILSTAATGLVTLTSLVLSLTLVAVQLAMGQFSPRIVGALLTDRRSQAAIGLFIGTFAYSMLVLREVNDKTGQIPGLSVLIAYALILSSVLAVVLFVHHAGQSIRVSGLIDLVGDNTRAQLDAVYPEAHRTAYRPDPGVVLSTAPGNVIHVDCEALVEIARRNDAVVEMLAPMGDFVAGGAPLFRVDPPASDEEGRRLLDAVTFGAERTHEDDPAYGIRKLVDIAIRSIASSPFDDPTTTVMAIHRIYDCLRMLAGRDFPSGRYQDAHGHLRLVVPMPSWDAYVRLAFDELRLVGAGSPQVARRLRAALDDLMAVAPAERQPVLERQKELLDGAVQRQFDEPADVEAALIPDTEGIGSGPDLIPQRARDAEREGPRRTGALQPTRN
jgi:uncharacterized membrane protein